MAQLIQSDDMRSNRLCYFVISEFAVNREKFGFILARLVLCLDAWVDQIGAKS